MPRDLIAELEATKRPQGRDLIAELESLNNSDGVEFSARTMIDNVPSSAKRLVEDIVTPFTQPIETAKAIGNVAAGAAQKLIPGEQGKEQYAEQIGQFIADRYGSMDAFKQSVMEDPVGVLADASTVLTGGATLAVRAPGAVGKAASTVQKVGAAIDPVNLATNTTKLAAKAVPASVPRSMYDSAAKWRTTLPPDQRARMTETALREGLPPSEKGVGKMHAKIRSLGDQLDSLIDNANGPIKASVVLKHIQGLKNDLGGFKINAADDVAKVQAIEDAFRDYMKNKGKITVTPRELQEFKTDAYKRINFDLEQGGASYAKNETAKAMARAAKEEIETVAPGAKDVNRQLGDLLELQPELERAAGRIDNHDLISLGQGVLTGAGAAVGGTTGAAVGGTLATIKRKGGQLAVFIEKLRRQGLSDTFLENEVLPVLIRGGLVESGRLAQSVNDPTEDDAN